MGRPSHSRLARDQVELVGKKQKHIAQLPDSISSFMVCLLRRFADFADIDYEGDDGGA